MLITLHIQNIGIIDDLTINFHNGLNVLTGETGAGKSLIIDALMILCGGRFSKEMIRKEEEFSFVEACIYAPNHEYAEEDNIIVSREIHRNGKNLCRINNRMVTVNVLKKVMASLIDVHAQNDSHSLMWQPAHINYLDRYASNSITPLKEEYQKLYENYKEIQKELDENFGNEQERQRTLDLLNYQYEEINQANLKIGEEEELESNLKVIKNYEKISSNLDYSCNILTEKVITNLDETMRALSKIEMLDNRYQKEMKSLQNAYYEIQDVSSNLNTYLYDNTVGELDATYVSQRLDLIYSLKRKYGTNILEILNYQKHLKEQIEHITNMDDYILDLNTKLEIIKNQMVLLCEKMHKLRIKNAQTLSIHINEQLKDLEMKNASFRVEVSFENEFHKNGLDRVEFLISTNVGEEYKPLTKIASGGEISRIMLAIKVALSHVDEVPIMIFDEIDTGISGSAARAVSEKMKKLSKQHQLICITHLAVIAAKADYNYFIQKNVINGNTKTSVKLLEENEVLNEIARMTSGEITNITLQHATELRKNCQLSA